MASTNDSLATLKVLGAAMSELNQLDRLLARWQDLCEQGPPPTAAEVCADCPELAGAFQKRLQGMEKMGACLEIDSSGAGQEASLLETSWETAGGSDLWPAVGQQKGDGTGRAGEEESPDNHAGLTGIEKGVAGTESGLSFLDPPDAPESLGRLGPYRVLDLLGEGGMGIVLKAEEPQPRRLVAIKVMRPERTTPHSRQRFLREGQALASVEHERVVPVYRVDEVRGVPFLVMPLLQGESLRERLRRDGRAPLAEVLRIGREVEPTTTEWQGLPAPSAAVEDRSGIRKNSGASLDGEVNSWDGLPRPSIAAGGLERPSHMGVQSVLGGLPNTADVPNAPPIRTGLLAVVFAPLLMLVRTRITISVKIKVVVVSAALLLMAGLVTLPVTSVAFSVTVSAALLFMTGVSFAYGYRGIAAIASKIASTIGSKGVLTTVVFGTSAIVGLTIGYYVLCYVNPRGDFLNLPPGWFPWKVEASDSEGG